MSASAAAFFTAAPVLLAGAWRWDSLRRFPGPLAIIGVAFLGFTMAVAAAASCADAARWHAAAVVVYNLSGAAAIVAEGSAGLNTTRALLAIRVGAAVAMAVAAAGDGPCAAFAVALAVAVAVASLFEAVWWPTRSA